MLTGFKASLLFTNSSSSNPIYDKITMSIKPSEEQVTAIISHYVRPRRESGYEQWLQGISQVARTFEGHLGATILKPQSGIRKEYVIILRFDRYFNLCRWMRSPERKEWIERAKPFIAKEENVQTITGLEYLVTLDNDQSTPPRYKTVLVTWLGVFVCSSILGYLLTPYLMDLPYLLRQAIMTGLVVVVLAYWVMPQLTHLFFQWLNKL